MVGSVAILVIASIIPLFALAHPGLPVTHDGIDHVARIANFYQSLSEGNIIPRWAANLNWGYGHPILMFLYPLPSYVASFFHAWGLSFVDSTKLVFAISFVASIVFMFLWLREQFGRNPAFVGALLYGFAPYRFVDLYVRGALGEHVAFVFPPLIAYGLLLLARKPNHRWFGIVVSVSTAALILSHNAVSIMILPLLIVYTLYLAKFESSYPRAFFLRSAFFVLLGLGLVSFFWLPAYFEGKYTLRDIVTRGEFTSRFVPFPWFLKSSWNYGGGNEFTKEIGLLQWLAMTSLFVVIWRVKRKERWFAGGLLVFFLISLLLMTSWSEPIWLRVTMLQKFQFPWRFLTVSVLTSSVAAGIVVAKVGKHIHVIVIAIVLLASIFMTQTMWKPQGYVYKPDDFFSGTYRGTTDTGESSPVWSVRFMEKEAKARLEIIEGESRITVAKRSSTIHSYVVDVTHPTRFVENTLYFPGWRVLIDGRQTPVEFQDPSYRGLMTFWVSPGPHRLDIIFGETKLRMFANTLSILSFLTLVFSWFASVYANKPSQTP